MMFINKTQVKITAPVNYERIEATTIKLTGVPPINHGVAYRCHTTAPVMLEIVVSVDGKEYLDHPDTEVSQHYLESGECIIYCNTLAFYSIALAAKLPQIHTPQSPSPDPVLTIWGHAR